MASAFGGLIAFGILYMDGVADYPGWRWLYIIEGMATIVIAAACFFAIPSSYTSAWFLNDKEKAIMRRRAEMTEAYSGGTGHVCLLSPCFRIMGGSDSRFSGIDMLTLVNSIPKPNL
jgi:MFS family permease